MRTNEIFTLESRELNEGKKVAFIAGGINRDINKANVKAKMKSIKECGQLSELEVVDGEDVVGFQRIAVSDGGIASDAHRAIVEIAVVVPLLAETRREFQIGNELVDHVDIEVVARHLLLNVQLVGDRQRVLGEIHSPFGLHLNHGAAGVVTVLLVGRKVRQIHQGALDHAVVDHAALGLHHAVLGIVHRIAETHRR